MFMPKTSVFPEDRRSFLSLLLKLDICFLNIATSFAAFSSHGLKFTPSPPRRSSASLRNFELRDSFDISLFGCKTAVIASAIISADETCAYEVVVLGAFSSESIETPSSCRRIITGFVFELLYCWAMSRPIV